MSRTVAAFVFALLAETAAAQPKEEWNRPGRPGSAASGARVASRRPPDLEVVYKTIETTDLKLAFFLPRDWKHTDQRPAIVFFFGGGFRAGNPLTFYSQAEYLAGRGMVAACADYRVKSRHNVTADKCFADARSAIRFVRAHAGKFGVDPHRLAAGGGSSGGALAASAAYGKGPDNPGDDPSISPRPDALILFNPAILHSLAGTDLLDGTAEEKEQLDTVLSPLKNLAKQGPPTVIFYGAKDGLLKTGREFSEKSRELGNACELYTAEDADHGFYNHAPWHDATLRKADEFLVSLGYLAGTPKIRENPEATLVKDRPK